MTRNHVSQDSNRGKNSSTLTHSFTLLMLLRNQHLSLYSLTFVFGLSHHLSYLPGINHCTHSTKGTSTHPHRATTHSAAINFPPGGWVTPPTHNSTFFPNNFFVFAVFGFSESAGGTPSFTTRYGTNSLLVIILFFPLAPLGSASPFPPPAPQTLVVIHPKNCLSVGLGSGRKTSKPLCCLASQRNKRVC